MNRYINVKMAWPLLIPFGLVFIGDAKIPVGASTATVPIAIIGLIPVIILLALKGRVALNTPIMLLLGVLLCGAIGAALSPVGNAARAIAAMLPVVFATLIMFTYSKNIVPFDMAIRYMLWGGAVLATLVILLYFFVALAQPGNYYQQKLLIETPLGRSNYLSAFLIFLVALSFRRNPVLAAYFILAIFCTMSRGGLLMLILLPVALVLSRRMMLILAIGALALFMFVLWAVHSGDIELLSRFVDPSDERMESTANRLLLWSFGTELWTTQPLFGIGPNNFRTFVEQDDGIEDVWGVHNTVLLLLLNYGIGGLVLYGTYLRIIYNATLAAEKKYHDFRYLRAAFIVLLIFGLFEPLVGSAAFEVLLSLIFALARSARSHTEFSSPSELLHSVKLQIQEKRS